MDSTNRLFVIGDGKGYLGMDQYEHRSWPAWHRHVTFVSIGLHLLLKLRLDSPSQKNSIFNLASVMHAYECRTSRKGIQQREGD
jgi:hypothetical protein